MHKGFVTTSGRSNARVDRSPTLLLCGETRTKGLLQDVGGPVLAWCRLLEGSDGILGWLPQIHGPRGPTPKWVSKQR